MSKPLLRIALVAIAAALSGCCMPGEECPGTYSNIVMNTSAGPVHDVELHWGGEGHQEHEEAGELPPNASGYFNYSPEDIPNSVVAYWRTADGKRHEKSLDLTRLMPDRKSFAGAIVFKIYDDDVAVEEMPRWMEERNQRLGKTTVP